MNDPHKPSSIHRRGKTRPADLRSPHDHSSFVARRFVRAWPRSSSFYCVPRVQSRSAALGPCRLGSAFSNRGVAWPVDSRPARIRWLRFSAASTKSRTANPKLPEFYRGMSIIGNSFSSICMRHRIVQFCYIGCRIEGTLYRQLRFIVDCICRGYLSLNSLTRLRGIRCVACLLSHSTGNNVRRKMHATFNITVHLQFCTRMQYAFIISICSICWSKI